VGISGFARSRSAVAPGTRAPKDITSSAPHDLHLIESRSRSLGPTINSREISITPPLASSPRPSTLATAAFVRNSPALLGRHGLHSAFTVLPESRPGSALLDVHCRSRRDYRRHRQVRCEAGRARPLNASGRSKSDGQFRRTLARHGPVLKDIAPKGAGLRRLYTPLHTAQRKEAHVNPVTCSGNPRVPEPAATAALLAIAISAMFADQEILQYPDHFGELCPSTMAASHRISCHERRV